MACEDCNYSQLMSVQSNIVKRGMSLLSNAGKAWTFSALTFGVNFFFFFVKAASLCMKSRSDLENVAGAVIFLKDDTSDGCLTIMNLDCWPGK